MILLRLLSEPVFWLFAIGFGLISAIVYLIVNRFSKYQSHLKLLIIAGILPVAALILTVFAIDFYMYGPTGGLRNIAKNITFWSLGIFTFLGVCGLLGSVAAGWSITKKSGHVDNLDSIFE